jgi:hypothetical protein
MTVRSEHLFLCPDCGKALSLGPACACGFVLREADGIINLLGDDEAAAVQPFLEAYERVRSKEEWGSDDLNLPFRAKRHRDIWKIRKRTFRAFESVATKLQPGVALDIAG